MVDVAQRTVADTGVKPRAKRRSGAQKFFQRKSTIAFLMALPLILLIACLVVYPAFYSMHLATLNKSM